MSAPQQRFKDVGISAIAHTEAPVIVKTADIEAELAQTLGRLGFPPSCLETLTGIGERRFWERGTLPSDAATDSAERLLANCGVDRSSIGLIINTSVSRDHIEPATAGIVHSKLGLGRDCMSFDLSNACVAFVNGMNVASAFIERGDIDHALVVNGEDARFVVESTIERLKGDDVTRKMFLEQFPTLTLGSAGAAMLLSRRSPDSEFHSYLGGLSVTASEHIHLSIGDIDEGRTDATGLLRAGIQVAKDGWSEAAANFGFADSDIDMYAIHQVSAPHTDALISALEMNPLKVPRMYQTHGNIGPAAIPTLLSSRIESEGIPDGHRIVMMAIGTGISASTAEVVW